MKKYWSLLCHSHKYYLLSEFNRVINCLALRGIIFVIFNLTFFVLFYIVLFIIVAEIFLLFYKTFSSLSNNLFSIIKKTFRLLHVKQRDEEFKQFFKLRKANSDCSYSLEFILSTPVNKHFFSLTDFD
jgi:hypothetical protein